METLPRGLLKTSAGQAAVTLAWLEGTHQLRIARVFGFKGPAHINVVIRHFIGAFYPDHEYRDYASENAADSLPQGDERKRLGNIAIMRYLESPRA